jgi:acetylornithine deacetylase/succinyl-diaminopimelate desuccinylase-like protein
VLDPIEESMRHWSAAPELGQLEPAEALQQIRFDRPFEGTSHPETGYALGPRLVGPEGVTFYPVLRGLESGNKIVTSGSFLVDVARKVDLSLISYYIRHVLRLPMRFFETRRVGEILSRVNDAVKEFFNFVGPELSWDRKFLLANLWLTEPWLARALAKSPLTDSMIRTTKATTIFHAGDKENVLPAQAQAIINFRLISNDTVDAVITRIRRTIDDARVKITPRPFPIDPSPISSVDAAGFKLVSRTISEVAPETIVAPFLTIAATDTRHYANLTKNIYRFVPIVFRPEDPKRIHGVDERISLADYLRCVRFYAQLIRNAQP